MDPKAYTNGEELWRKILETLNTNEDRLFARYDCVIQMHTAPRLFISSNVQVFPV